MNASTFATPRVSMSVRELRNSGGYEPGSVQHLSTLRPDDARGWEACFEDLAKLYAYTDGWDGLDARAPDFALLEAAGELARLLRNAGHPPPSRTIPGVTGTVILEWQTALSYTEIEVAGPTEVEVTEVVEGRDPVYSTFNWGGAMRTAAARF